MTMDKSAQTSGIADTFKLPASRITIDNIITNIIETDKDTTKILPKEKRRYVIYCRKSTENEDRQVRSLSDQVEECLAKAKRLGVKVKPEDIIQEAASAKQSGHRVEFDKMLSGFRSGKYHGLISWAPDRISRNMKEAGEVIEMVDNELIQDLSFCTYEFDNSPNGKMMLGILFATSKQYSDKLSVDVKRGNVGSVKEGKYMGKIKRGYCIDPYNGYFIPDPQNWHLVRRAVVMRVHEGKTAQEVADFLNSSNYTERKFLDDKPKRVKMTDTMVTNMLSKPFYTGAYQHGSWIANLTELYNFMPLMSPDEFAAANKKVAEQFKQKYVGHANASTRMDFGILRGKVICDFCDSIMGFERHMIHRGENKGAFEIMYVCKNKECDRRLSKEACMAKYGKPSIKKSIRLRDISIKMDLYLANLTKNTKKAYEIYIDRLKQKNAVDIARAQRLLKQAKTSIRDAVKQRNKFINLHADNTEEYRKYHNGKIEEYTALIAGYEESARVQQDKLNELTGKLPSQEQFVELVNSYLLTYRNMHDLVEEDAFYNEMVLNLRAGDESISVINLNPPYDIMADLDKISLGWG